MIPELVLIVAGATLVVFGAVRFAQGRPAASLRSSALSSSATGKAAVTIAGFAFAPDPLQAHVGAPVTFTNNDNFAHTATSDIDGLFDSKRLASGATFIHTFAKTGAFTYHCAIHNSMTGTIVVS